MLMPMLITLVSCCIGNLLGYTVLKNVVVNMYYNSYSLPTYHTLFSADAFIQTTIIPLCLIFVIDGWVIYRKLKFSPLAFLRHDLHKAKQRHAISLRHGSFLHRIQWRMTLQNIPTYATVCVGIFFVMILLSMAIGLPDTLKHYQNDVSSLMLAKYETIVTDDDVTTSVSSAESFLMETLNYKTNSFQEEVSIFGVKTSSQFTRSKQLRHLKGNQILISQSMHDKYDIQVGDTIVLHAQYDFHLRIKSGRNL